MLQGKKIIVAVSASIAAYKAAVLVRLLVKEGALVKVVMTKAATDFITPLTLATLSKDPVLIDFTKGDNGEWNNHVELGLWADAMVIAPASANTLAKMAQGICDNLLIATYLSARCPVFLAPAMDLDMLAHGSTQNNLHTLKSYGNHIIESAYGELASGLIGNGRMAEPEEIVTKLNSYFGGGKLKGKKALVTAGPTYEAIDPVRFIGNHSSGKMGFAIAECLANEGVVVTLVTGPTHQNISHPNIHVIAVTSAQQMYEQCATHFSNQDITVLSAAVADYKPLTQADQKIKKKEGNLTIELTQTIDIAATLGKQKNEKQLLIGFALETEHEKNNALKKLESKNFDLIVLNSLNDKGAGFGHDTNKITLINRREEVQEFPLKDKKAVATDIVKAIIQLLHA